MALDQEKQVPVTDPSTPPPADFKGRHFAIAGNVVFSVMVATAIVVVLQWGSYYADVKVDLTDEGVNSLTPGTERLLEGLEQKVRYTSMYFETDLEEKDQSKYRTNIDDLLDLYQSANRSMIEVEHLNPLKDLAKRRGLIERLQKLERFEKESQPYRELIDNVRNRQAQRIGELIQAELDQLAAFASGTSAESEKNDLGQIQNVLEFRQRQLGRVIQEIDEAVTGLYPRYGAAKSTVSTFYSNMAKDLNAIAEYAGQLIDRRSGMSSSARDYLAGIEDRCRPLIDDIEEEAAAARELPGLELENILRQLGDTANALVVESAKDAKVVSFSEIWPAMNPGVSAMNSGFKNRLFKGEEKLTAATLQLTQEEQTAVIFVRYSGPPLFFGGMPGQRMPAPYAQLKEVLEDANFVVDEWDVSSTDTLPEIDPPPVRTIYVVLRPTQPPQGPMGQTQQTPFGDSHMETVVERLDEGPRAIFLAGWETGSFGMFPASYGYHAYLQDTWGIDVVSDTLILQAIGVGPGKFALAQQSFSLADFVPLDHLLVNNLQGRTTELRLAAPIEIAGNLPEGVVVEPLLRCRRGEGLWGVKNIQPYIQKARAGEDVVKQPEDLEGPFTVAVAAEKGEGKIVVISSAGCMTDQVALAPVMMLTSQGFTLRQRNPGNVALLLNALHWLNDKEEWMDVGRPANFGTIEIAEGPTLTFIRLLVGGIWPALAVCCGVVAWWVRRR